MMGIEMSPINCTACFAPHPREAWVCAACGRNFVCASQFATVETGRGTLRGHVRPATSPDRLGDTCGPINAGIVARAHGTPYERAKRWAKTA